MKIKLQIKNRFTGSVLFEYEKEDNTIKDTLLEAIKQSADLRYANLQYTNLQSANLRYTDLQSANLQSANLQSANLRYTNLQSANLRYANLQSADLQSANLQSANLQSANLRYTDLQSANLTPIKDDFFAVLVRSIPEIKFLKQNIIEGKIDGSTYDGECSCLSGTLECGAKFHNGPNEMNVISSIIGCRDSSRPIEMFFLNIKEGDTPETNQSSKIALEWLEEFEFYISQNVRA